MKKFFKTFLGFFFCLEKSLSEILSKSTKSFSSEFRKDLSFGNIWLNIRDFEAEKNHDTEISTNLEFTFGIFNFIFENTCREMISRALES